MVEQIQETRESVTNDGGTSQSVRRVTTTDGAAEKPASPRSVDGNTTVVRVVWFITGVLMTLLAFRFVLSLLGANRGNAFADLIYGFTYPFVAPFFGLFGYQVRYGVSRFEVETLVAMAVYALVGYGIARLLTINRRDREV